MYITFSNCLIERIHNNHVGNSIFWKSTHSERYVDFELANILLVKVAVARNLIDRINNLVMETENKQIDLNLMLYINDCSEEFLHKIMENVFTERMEKYYSRSVF